MSDIQNINPIQSLSINGEPTPFAEFNQDTFLPNVP